MRRLTIHLLGYGLVLVVVTVLVPLRASFGSDDGAYGGAVYAARHGGWVLERPVPVVAGANEGWVNGAVTPAGPVPYSANPAYVALLSTVARVVAGPPRRAERGGDLSLALHLPGLAATLVSATLAWRLAGRWDRRAAPLAFWLLGLGPLLVDATALWAHPLGTAAAGAATLALAELWHRPKGTRAPAWRALFAVALAAGAVVRTEAVFWTLALVATAVLADRRGHRSRAMLVTALGGGTAAAAAWAVNRAWGRSIRSPELAIRTGADLLAAQQSWLSSRAPAAWQLVLTWPGQGPGSLLPLVALLVAILAAVQLRRARIAGTPQPVVPVVLLLGASGLYLFKAAVAPAVVIPGIAAAWPAVVVALVVAAPSRHRITWSRPIARRRTVTGDAVPANLTLAMVEPTATGAAGPAPGWLLVPVALMTAVVLVTQYPASGGLQWGGRYLSMAYVPLAAAAGIALVPVLADGTRLARASLAALALTPAVAGTVTSWRLHTTHATIVDLTTRPPAEVVITDQPALPRIAWTNLPTAYYLATADDIGALLDQLAGAGVRTVNVAGMTTTEVDGLGGYTLATTINSPQGTIRQLMKL